MTSSMLASAEDRLKPAGGLPAAAAAVAAAAAAAVSRSAEAARALGS